MDEIDPTGRMRHDVPTHLVMRLFLIAAGAFIIVVSTLELWRGVWPPSLFGLPLAGILVGAMAVGIPMILAGLLSPSLRWTIGPRRIDIALETPVHRRAVSFSPGDIAGFDLKEYDSDGGPSNWAVSMLTSSGKRFQTRQFGTRTRAEQMKGDIERIFYAR